MADREQALLSSSAMNEPLRVALVSGSPLVLAGLRAGLAERGEIKVVLACASMQACRDQGFGAAQVAIVDAPAAADALDDGPAMLLLVPEAGTPIGDWLAQGCSLLPRNASIEQIVAAARAAAVGLVAGTRPLLASALRIGQPPQDLDDLEPLTPREREVLRKMTEGLGNREIANELQISSHTAKFHVAQVIAKLDASSRAHAVAKGLRAGLVEL